MLVEALVSNETIGSRPRAIEAVVRNAAYAEALIAYANGRAQLPQDLPPALSAPALREALGTDDGRRQAEIWTQTFAQSLALMLAFRNALVHWPGQVSDDEVLRVAQAGERIFNGLVKRLRGTLLAA